MRIVINENERGLLYKDGKLERWLTPGRHSIWAWSATLRVDRLDLDEGYTVATPELMRLVPTDEAEELVVAANEVAVVTVDGQPRKVLEAGRYLLWKARGKVEATRFALERDLAELPPTFASLFSAHTLKSWTVKANERGVLVRDGRLVAWLDPGRVDAWCRDRTVELQRFDLNRLYVEATPELRAIVPEAAATSLVVGEHELAILCKEGRPQSCLGPGAYLLWSSRDPITAKVYPTDVLDTQVPRSQWELVPDTLMLKHTVLPHQRLLFYLDGKLERIFEAGSYGLHCVRRKVSVALIDLREQEVQINGQEVMTADKVSLRVNLIAKYRVVDPLAAHESVVELQTGIYSEAQMAMRRYIAATRIDTLLEGRNTAAETMLAQVAPRVRDWGVELVQVDLKDIILPGEMKTLLNRVIEAEKEAAAKVILRREETAATRSLANTATLLAGNPTLMRLKELETLKEIAGNVGNVTVVASPNELRTLLKIGEQ